MKRLLLTGFAALSCAVLSAQALQGPRIYAEDMNPGIISVDKATGKKVVTRAESMSDVYSFVSAYGENWMLGDPSSYVRWISEDSNAVTIYTDQTTNEPSPSHNFVHVLGSSFDPKDSSYFAIGKPVLTRYNPYKIDTIYFLQFYVRNTDSVDLGNGNEEVVDTVFVQYFDFNGMTMRAFTRNGTNRNMSPDVDKYVPSTRLNTAAVATDTILLTTEWADSVNFDEGQLFGRLVKMVPENFNSLSTSGADVSANVTGFAITFKPMIKPNLGDTFINWNDPASFTPKLNGYGVRVSYWENHAQDILTLWRLNNTFWTISSIADGQTINGWRSYLPTTAYTTTTMLDCDFAITTDNMSVSRFNNGISQLKVVPNPASTASEVGVLFNLEKSSNVYAIVRDINGKVVSTINEGAYNKGINEMLISTENFTAGIYTVSVISNFGTQSSKFIVQ